VPRNTLIAAEIEGHEFWEGEGHGEHVFVFVDNRPNTLAVHAVGVDRKACFLEGFQVTVDGTGVAILLFDKIGNRLAVLG